MKRTPLYDLHVKYGGKMIEFGGWELPVRYGDIIEEHEKVRTAAGLFDVSHMGEITIKGADAENLVQLLITNDISKARNYQVVYSPMCYPDGGVVDDLLVYKYDREHFLLVVNASNTDKDYEWIKENASGSVQIENVSDKYAQLALQGPMAEEILQKLTGIDLQQMGFYTFLPDVNVGGVQAIVSRTGYTGEDGFEIYIEPEKAPALWEKILETGREYGIVPVGLGARDTLRFEAALPLYGHELSPDISPLEAGLGVFVKLDKAFFIGKDALSKQKQQGTARKLAGFEMLDKGVPRNGYEVQSDGRTIGFVTTGSYSPTLKKNIGIALVEPEFCKEGTGFNIVIRNKALKANVVKLPFYKKKYKK